VYSPAVERIFRTVGLRFGVASAYCYAIVYRLDPTGDKLHIVSNVFIPKTLYVLRCKLGGDVHTFGRNVHPARERKAPDIVVPLPSDTTCSVV
jgi:hypothetical protein